MRRSKARLRNHAAVVLAASMGVWASGVLGRAASPGAVPQAQAVGVSPAGSVLDGVYTASQATRGEQTFQKMCMSCHTVAEHTGRRFGAKWAGTTVGDLFDLLSNTMPEADPGSLKPDEYASILAFFLKASGYPEGPQELPSSLPALQKLRIEPVAN